MHSIEELKSKNILIIDDENDLLDNLEMTVAVFFKNVFSASNGEEALKIFKKEKIDVVMTDYVMPRIDGYEFAQKIREQNPDIPIAIMSNFTDKDKLLKSIPLNLTDYIIKPLNYQKLITLFQRFLSRIHKENPDLIFINNVTQFDSEQHKIYFQDESITLTKSESIVLKKLLESKNSVVVTENLALSLSYSEFKSEKAVKNIIYRLRKKLQIIDTNLIQNIQGSGYLIKSS